MGKEILRIENLSKSFENKKILDRIDLVINRGEVVALVGPSGEGKSTILRCIAGLEDFEQGSIKVKGRVGMVFQSYNLFPNLTVLQNVSLALRLVKKMDRAVSEERAKKELNKMGLSKKMNSYPAQLSGGQAQRVAIARALALDPVLMLFDEPTSALDPQLKEKVLKVISRIAIDENIAILLVTHEINLAKKYSGRVVKLKNGIIIV
jgi:ABC-type polar amino acid transport system ATPase subunit